MNEITKLTFFTALLLLAPTAALAQNALPNAVLDRFIPGTAQASISVSANNATVPLPQSPNTGIKSVLVYNVGANAAHFTLGNAQAVDTPTGNFPDYVLQPGCFVTAVVGAATNLATISPAGPTTLHLFGGTGSPGGGCVN